MNHWLKRADESCFEFYVKRISVKPCKHSNDYHVCAVWYDFSEHIHADTISTALGKYNLKYESPFAPECVVHCLQNDTWYKYKGEDEFGCCIFVKDITASLSLSHNLC